MQALQQKKEQLASMMSSTLHFSIGGPSACVLVIMLDNPSHPSTCFNTWLGIKGTKYGMDSEFKLTAPQAPIEPMDFLSRNWCKSTIQVFQPENAQDGSVVLQENSMKPSSNDVKAPLQKMERSSTTINMDDSTSKSIPPWKSNDVKSWIWLQQAMHPEVKYDRCFRKKWIPWKMNVFKNISIKKWMKEMKQKRKEDERLQRAEVHAAISVAGVAAALAAVAAENNKNNQSNTPKETAVASAAALVAAQCAQVAEAMGAKREQLSTVMGSAMFSASAAEILSLTAAAATSLRGAATLRARPGRGDRFNGSTPLIPIEDSNDFDFDFDNCKSLLAKGVDLNIETVVGKRMHRSVSITLNREAKVILKIKKANVLSALTSSKQSIVLDLHAELYKDSFSEAETSYYLVLTTNRGIIKIDMEDDYDRYRTWAMTINHMLMLSTTFTGYELQFYKN